MPTLYLFIKLLFELLEAAWLKFCLLGEAHNEMKFLLCAQVDFFISYPLFFGINMLLCFIYNEACFSLYVLPVSPTCIASEFNYPKKYMSMFTRWSA